MCAALNNPNCTDTPSVTKRDSVINVNSLNTPCSPEDSGLPCIKIEQTSSVVKGEKQELSLDLQQQKSVSFCIESQTHKRLESSPMVPEPGSDQFLKIPTETKGLNGELKHTGCGGCSASSSCTCSNKAETNHSDCSPACDSKPSTSNQLELSLRSTSVCGSKQRSNEKAK